jgi:hypothetical protein
VTKRCHARAAWRVSHPTLRRRLRRRHHWCSARPCNGSLQRRVHWTSSPWQPSVGSNIGSAPAGAAHRQRLYELTANSPIFVRRVSARASPCLHWMIHVFTTYWRCIAFRHMYPWSTHVEYIVLRVFALYLLCLCMYFGTCCCTQYT